MNHRRAVPAVIGGVVLTFCAISTIPVPALAGQQPWIVNVQEIASYTPLEIKLGYYDSAPATRIGAAVLWNNGTDNVIDIFDIGVDANGVMIDNTFSSVVSGQVFALGEVCVMDDWFIVPYSDNFDLRAIRCAASGVRRRARRSPSGTRTATACTSRATSSPPAARPSPRPAA